MSANVDYLVQQFNILDRFYSSSNQKLNQVTMKMNGTHNTTVVDSITVQECAQAHLKTLCSFYTTLFTLDKERFKTLLSDDVQFTFVRMKGGFEWGTSTQITGAEKVYDFLCKSIFDITSNFDIKSINLEFNGQNTTVDIDVDEDKMDGMVKKRYHMNCHDFIQINSQGKIVSLLSRNSRDPLI